MNFANYTGEISINMKAATQTIARWLCHLKKQRFNVL